MQAAQNFVGRAHKWPGFKWLGLGSICLAISACAAAPHTSSALSDLSDVWQPVREGQYQNPPINADFPDPDIIRVGDTFYMVSTTFANVPAITILESRDLVHWAYVGHVASDLADTPTFQLSATQNAYRHGMYAASLRQHNDRFYIAVTPVGLNTRIYSASSMRGPWVMQELDRQAFDPGLLFDTDGTPYIFTSIGSDGTITLLTLNNDLSAITDARVIYRNPGAEGSKVLRRHGYYYIFNAIPRRLGLTVSRSRSLDGPWETRNQIDDTSGGHQGAIVDLPDGTDYGFVMLDAGAIGRVTNISPIYWQDGWPVWGTPEAPNRVPDRAPLPLPADDSLRMATSDDFSAAQLGPQWQWNHNPNNSLWSLSQRAGFLRLHATQADNFWIATNTLTQKAYGPASRYEATVDTSHLQAGDQCGIGSIGKYSALAIIERTETGGNNQRRVHFELREDFGDSNRATRSDSPVTIDGNVLEMAVSFNFSTNIAHLDVRAIGGTWQRIAENVPQVFDWRTGTFQGPQFAIFCYGTGENRGFIDVDGVRVGPGD